MLYNKNKRFTCHIDNKNKLTGAQLDKSNATIIINILYNFMNILFYLTIINQPFNIHIHFYS